MTGAGDGARDLSWIPPEIVVDRTADLEALQRIRDVVEAGPFRDSWESLTGYRVPDWFSAAKFGIFLHWGVYSVPAFENEWYSRNMYLEGSRAFKHHVARYGEQRSFGYKDFIPAFTMERFDPHQWVDLLYRAGAQFVVPVAEHHDGFAMYEEPRSRWKAPLMGPGRDVVGELSAAAERRQLVVGASSHRAEHWFFMGGGARFDSDVRDSRFADLYGPAMRQETGPNEAFCEDWLLRTVGIVDRYRPQVLFFDWWIEHPAFEPYLRLLAAYYYNRAAEWGRGVVLTYKNDAFRPGAAVFDVERGSVSQLRPDVWQSDTSVSRTSWCYVEDHQYKSTVDLLDELLDTVAKNGVLLLNIGPRPDGTIPAQEVRLLEEIGAWLDIHREAIYGTTPWIIAGEGPTVVSGGPFSDGEPLGFTHKDFRFTTRRFADLAYVYATTTRWPSDGVLTIRSFGMDSGLLSEEITEVSLLGHDAPLNVQRNSEGLTVQLPDRRPSGHGATIRLGLRASATPLRSDYLHG